MIHDPALALHTVKQAQQEHRDIAAAHRLSRLSADPRRNSVSSRWSRRPARLLRARRPAVTLVEPRRHLSTP
jgi:hypothetical protein